MFSQNLFLRRVSERGIPRYLMGRVPILKPRILARQVLTFPCVLKKNIQDFSLLIIVPEASIKVLRIFLILLASLRVAWHKSMILSRNYWWLMGR